MPDDRIRIQKTIVAETGRVFGAKNPEWLPLAEFPVKTVGAAESVLRSLPILVAIAGSEAAAVVEQHSAMLRVAPIFWMAP